MHLLLTLLTREPGALPNAADLDTPSETQAEAPVDGGQGKPGCFLDRVNHPEDAGYVPAEPLFTPSDMLAQTSGVVLDGPWVRGIHGVAAADIVVYVDGTRRLNGLGSYLFP